MLPLPVKLAVVIPIILLVIFVVIFCSNLNKESNIPVGVVAGDSPGAETELDLAEAITLLSQEIVAHDPDREAFVEDFWRWTFGEAGLPERLARYVAASALESPAFVMELLVVLQYDACYLSPFWRSEFWAGF